MPADESTLLEALRRREEAGRLLHKLDVLQDSDSVPDDARRQLRQEYVDRILAAEHEVARLKDGLSAELGSAQGERARRLRAIIDAETTADLEAISGTHRSSRSPVPVPASESPSLANPHRRVRPFVVGLVAVGIVGFILTRWGLPAISELRDASSAGRESTAIDVSLKTGDRVAIGAGQVAAGGGELVVSGTNGPLDGLALEVPSGSYEQTVTFDLAYQPIEGFDAPEGVDVLTPLIHLDASTPEHSSSLIALTVPVDVPEGHFASLFIYDEATHALKGLPTLEESDGTLTMLGTHFCPIVALSAPYERLIASGKKVPGNLDELKVPTRFRPERDMWNLVNAGSSAAPGGYCRGMSLSSLYYYTVEGGIQGTPLFESEYDNGLPEGTATPGFWQDARFAIQLCSVASNLGTTREAGSVEDALATRIGLLTPGRQPTNQQRQFYMTALALYVTGAPQLLGVHSSTGGGGHSLLCYGVDGHSLSIADPNYPGKRDITMEFKDERLGPYRSAQNAKDIASGRYVDYDRVYYEGDISFFTLPKLQRYWTDYEAGGLDSHFPRYTVRVTELDENGAAGEAYSLDVLSGVTTDAPRLRFDLEAGVESRLTLSRYGNPPSAVTGNLLDPEPGDSYVGFLVEQKTAFGWEWADFNWVRVSATGEEPSQPSAPGQLDFTSCHIDVEFDAVARDTYSGEVRQVHNWHISAIAAGSFSGDTFTARWSEEHLADMPSESFRDEGQMTVTLDADRDEVTSFTIEHQWTYNCGGILRYTASGSGAKRYMGGVGSSGLFLDGSEAGGMPRPTITWLEREPGVGPECGAGYRTYELLSSEDFSVLIQFMH